LPKDSAPLPVLTFPQNSQLLTKEKEPKRKSYNNSKSNNCDYFASTNLKAKVRELYQSQSLLQDLAVDKRLIKISKLRYLLKNYES
jgi:hypothetical protein